MEKRKSRDKYVTKENAVDLFALLVIWLFLFTYFKPELIFSPTTTSGGDTGSHNYLEKYMRESLSKGKIIGWSHDSYVLQVPPFVNISPRVFASPLWEFRRISLVK